jgi:hypothetical protein
MCGGMAGMLGELQVQLKRRIFGGLESCAEDLDMRERKMDS